MLSVRYLGNVLFQRNYSIICSIVSTPCKLSCPRGSKNRLISCKNAKVMFCICQLWYLILITASSAEEILTAKLFKSSGKCFLLTMLEKEEKHKASVDLTGQAGRWRVTGSNDAVSSSSVAENLFITQWWGGSFVAAFFYVETFCQRVGLFCTPYHDLRR